MKKTRLLVLLFFTLSICYGQKKDSDFMVMFYNVENLFDIVDNPETSDEEFTPGSEKKWDEEKYEKKLKDISDVIKAVGKKELPEIVGLCEVENQKVLQDLVDTRSLRRGNYGIIHYDSPDSRGIDCAFLYRTEKFTVSNSRSVPVIFPFDSSLTTRDILYVEGTTNEGETLHFFINHWSSRAEGERESQPKRMFCAVTLRKEVDAIMNRDPEARILIMGDLNDEPSNRSVFEMLLANYLTQTSSMQHQLVKIQIRFG